jgi:signal transduction histidine kinase
MLDLDEHTEVSREWREALVRLTREAIGLATRHGGASVVSLHLRRSRHVTLRIVDDGRSDRGDGHHSEHDLIVRSLRERAEALGASLSYELHPGTGAALEVILP